MVDDNEDPRQVVSTHSRAKAAAEFNGFAVGVIAVSTHSRAKAAALVSCTRAIFTNAFQHTAARRRLL